MVQSLIILNTIQDADGFEWLVQWTEHGIRHEKFFFTFEAVSRYVEGELLN